MTFHCLMKLCEKHLRDLIRGRRFRLFKMIGKDFSDFWGFFWNCFSTHQNLKVWILMYHESCWRIDRSKTKTLKSPHLWIMRNSYLLGGVHKLHNLIFQDFYPPFPFQCRNSIQTTWENKRYETKQLSALPS